MRRPRISPSSSGSSGTSPNMIQLLAQVHDAHLASAAPCHRARTFLREAECCKLAGTLFLCEGMLSGLFLAAAIQNGYKCVEGAATEGNIILFRNFSNTVQLLLMLSLVGCWFRLLVNRVSPLGLLPVIGYSVSLSFVIIGKLSWDLNADFSSCSYRHSAIAAWTAMGLSIVQIWRKFNSCHVARHPLLLWVYILVYVLSGTGTNLSLRLLLTKMSSFQFFVVQSACFMYVPFTASLLVVDAFRKRLKFRVILNREINKRFLLMAFLDCIANFLVIFGAAHTNLAFQTLVPQAVIPVSMLIGWLVLGSSFTVWQITGSVTVMVGVGIVCIPIFFDRTAVLPNLPQNAVFWTVLLFLSNFPMALSALVKELMLHHRSRDVPVSYLNTAVSCLQLLIGFVIAPIGSVGAENHSINGQLRDGFHCLIGKLPGICETSAVFEYICFCLLMFTMNITLLFVVRYGSSSIMYAASALVLPLSNLANTSAVIMGASAQALDPFTIGGLVPILVGILLYANSREICAEKSERNGRIEGILDAAQPDTSALAHGLLNPGEACFPLSARKEDFGILFNLDTLIPPRGLVGSGASVVPWIPICSEKSKFAKWAVTANVRGDLVSPLLRGQRRRHSSPPSPRVDEISMSPAARGHGIWIPEKEAQPVEDKTNKDGGFYQWGLQVEH